MATTQQASFTLTLFECSGDRLRLGGRWTGVEENAVSQATLILHTSHRVHRLEAVSGTFNRDNWHVVFAWQGDPELVERAELELGKALVVELPSGPSNPGRGRRFTRNRLPVQELEQPRGASDGPADDDDVLGLHSAMVAAQEEAAKLRDERARLIADAQSARQQAKHEREQRESDVVRLREAINSLRRLAEDALRKEREATRSVSIELDELEAFVSTSQAEMKRLRSELADTRQELQDATEEGNRLRSTFDALRDVIDEGD
jgi:hypothetical protein